LKFSLKCPANSQDITRNLNNSFFPFELRTFFGKSVFNGSASGLCELSSGSADSSVKLVPRWTFDGFTTSETVTASLETNPHQKTKKKKDRISPQVYVSLHPHVGIYEKFFKKVHCFEFRAGASSAD